MVANWWYNQASRYNISTAHIYPCPSFDPIDTHRLYLGVNVCHDNETIIRDRKIRAGLEWLWAKLSSGEHLAGDP